MTFVKIEGELILANSVCYEIVATLNHHGRTRNSGHYVTHLKLDSDHWMKFDDAHIQKSSLKQANNTENYILLFKRKEAEMEPDVVEVDHEDFPLPSSVLVRQNLSSGVFSVEFYGCNFPFSDPCAMMPCKNGGTCLRNGTLHDYNCQCPQNYFGEKCQYCKL